MGVIGVRDSVYENYFKVLTYNDLEKQIHMSSDTHYSVRSVLSMPWKMHLYISHSQNQYAIAL